MELSTDFVSRAGRILGISLFTFSLLMLLMLMVGCKRDRQVQGPAGLSPVVVLQPATATQCPTGGQAILIDGVISGAVCNGQQGLTGNEGATGPTGASGSTPTLSVVNASISDCPTGGVVVIVNSTPSGVICNGANGTPGTDLTPVSIVQFCPNVTTYPTTFSEIGFCISSKVYGTYSANDGFSAYLPPGTYSSNGINSSCTFTIGANCAISH